jgi:hypothetical protein
VKWKGSILLIFTEKEISRRLIMLKGSKMEHLLLPESIASPSSIEFAYFKHY